MLSFKQFITESEGESFKTFKLGRYSYIINGSFIKIKDEIRRISGTINFYRIFKVPMINGNVNFEKKDEIEHLDTHIVDIDNLHEMQDGKYYSPFKTGTTENEASYLKSVFVDQFLESEKKHYRMDKFSIAKDVEKQLKKKRGEYIEDDEL